MLVAAISVAMEDPGLPNDGPAALSEYLEEIVAGLSPVVGGRRLTTTSGLVISLQ